MGMGAYPFVVSLSNPGYACPANPSKNMMPEASIAGILAFVIDCTHVADSDF